MLTDNPFDSLADDYDGIRQERCTLYTQKWRGCNCHAVVYDLIIKCRQYKEKGNCSCPASSDKSDIKPHPTRGRVEGTCEAHKPNTLNSKPPALKREDAYGASQWILQRVWMESRRGLKSPGWGVWRMVLGIWWSSHACVDMHTHFVLILLLPSTLLDKSS
jgi:hypothetical protein